jgi:ABC-type hemin transport system ATPase subunit
MLILSSGSTVAIGAPSEVLQEDLLTEIYAHPLTKSRSLIDTSKRASPHSGWPFRVP